MSFPILYRFFTEYVHCHPRCAGVLLKAVFKKRRRKISIVFCSVQTIHLQHLAELQEASGTILKQKIGIWFVMFVWHTAQKQWKTVPLKKQLKETNSISVNISQKVHYVMRMKQIHSWKSGKKDLVTLLHFNKVSNSTLVLNMTQVPKTLDPSLPDF